MPGFIKNGLTSCEFCCYCTITLTKEEILQAFEKGYLNGFGYNSMFRYLSVTVY